ncbi:hypothetical protein GCK72_017108 [Caenorhabditis remanei]|uniref:Chondroitin proteoglycan 4 domain-containing protein n=1 Tax=Caenorhabditis remanei TaxID=31234 RepID=A0A6A5G6G4_CAERE|nr:hypothetical protein GCK72_017108 [Caenorhabditis remanei]KAF1750557.1 hypothetical protein GCK72_017108 [Caenorhabditis remanei]
MKTAALLGLLLILSTTTFAFDPQATHTLDPAIPTVAPHTTDSSADSCAGQCAFQFMDNIRSQIGQDRASSLMQLNFNDFLTSFSNTTFFEKFCKIYHNFQSCESKCTPGFLHQLLMRSSEIIDHYCVYNFDKIREKFPCLIKMKPNKDCVKTCTPHHDAVSSMTENFKNLVLSGDTTRAEQYLAQGCEYITCTLHCDVPTIAHECDSETAQLVIDLTRRSFASMEKMALDTNAVAKWPQVCADVKTYRMPTPSAPPKGEDDNVVAQSNIVADHPITHPKLVQAPLVRAGSVLSIFLATVIPVIFLF